MSDWNDFRAEVPWGVTPRTLNVGPEESASQHGFAPSDQARRTFPRLMHLLSKARMTPIWAKDGRYVLFGWDRATGGTCGWLSPVASGGRPGRLGLHPDHRALLECFGGVVERWKDPTTNLLVGVDKALTEQESVEQAAEWHAHYLELCGAEGLVPVITLPEEYAVFVVEGNSNRLLYHRVSGEVIYFAPDPAPHLDTQVLEGAPEYTLYRIVDLPDFVSWVETLARQWLAAVAP